MSHIYVNKGVCYYRCFFFTTPKLKPPLGCPVLAEPKTAGLVLKPLVRGGIRLGEEKGVTEGTVGNVMAGNSGAGAPCCSASISVSPLCGRMKGLTFGTNTVLAFSGED